MCGGFTDTFGDRRAWPHDHHLFQGIQLFTPSTHIHSIAFRIFFASMCNSLSNDLSILIATYSHPS